MEAEVEGGTSSAPVISEESPNDAALYPSVEDIEDRSDGNNLKADNSEVNSVRPNSAAPPLIGFNFWDVNSYKRTVKRIDDGAKLCDDLLKLLAERAEIEGLYAAKLQGKSRVLNTKARLHRSKACFYRSNKTKLYLSDQ